MNRRVAFLLVAVGLLVVGGALILVLRPGPTPTLILAVLRTPSYRLSYPQNWKPLAIPTGSLASVPLVILGPPDSNGEPTGELVLRQGPLTDTATLSADADEFKRAAQLLHLTWRINATTEPTLPGAKSSVLVDAQYSIEGGAVQVREIDLFALASNQTLYHLTAMGEVGAVSGEDLQKIISAFQLVAVTGPSSTP